MAPSKNNRMTADEIRAIFQKKRAEIEAVRSISSSHSKYARLLTNSHRRLP
jgi:hypothetical protein